MTGFDTLSTLIRYEEGDLTYDETLEFFQHLIDTGLAWQLQGHYGRTAAYLISEGLCGDPSPRD
jgi:hypothetical protein